MHREHLVHVNFWRTVTSNCPPYAPGLLSCLSLCLSVCLSVCKIVVLWPIGWMDEDATWYTEISLDSGDIVCVYWFPAVICIIVVNLKATTIQRSKADTTLTLSCTHKTQQVVKVIWHKAASPQRTDGSVVFARWHQCAPHIQKAKNWLPWHLRTLGERYRQYLQSVGRPLKPRSICLVAIILTKPVRAILVPKLVVMATSLSTSGLSSNARFLGPLRAHNPNSISIGSAVFGRLTSVTHRQTDQPQTTLRR